MGSWKGQADGQTNGPLERLEDDKTSDRYVFSPSHAHVLDYSCAESSAIIDGFHIEITC